MSIYTVWKQFSLRSLRLLYQTHFHIENAENLESPECLQYESLENSFSLFHFAKAEQQLKTALTLSANNSIVLTYILLLLICILRSRADSEAFQSGRYAEHNGRPKTLKKVA